MVNASYAGLFGAVWPPSLSLLSAQEVSMATLHPLPLQPVLHSQCQLFCPIVHCPLPLHRLGQPSAKDVGHREKKRGRDRGYSWSKSKVSHKMAKVNSGHWLTCSIVPIGHAVTCTLTHMQWRQTHLQHSLEFLLIWEYSIRKRIEAPSGLIWGRWLDSLGLRTQLSMCECD